MHFMIFKALATINKDNSSVCDCFVIIELQVPLLCRYIRYDFYRINAPFGGILLPAFAFFGILSLLTTAYRLYPNGDEEE